MSLEGFASTDPVTTFMTRLERYGLENTFARRYYSKYGGKIISTADPTDQGRVRVMVPVTGIREPLALWAYPSSPYAGPNRGFYFPPEKGDDVWVWFEHGDTHHPNISGGWWAAPKKTAASSYVPEEFKADGAEPTARGIKTKRGHGLLFEDDTAEDPRVEIWTADTNPAGVEAVKVQRLVLSNKPGLEQIQLVSKSGLVVRLLDQAGQERLELTTPSGHKLTLRESPATTGVELTSALGLKLTLDDVEQHITLETPVGQSVKLDDAALTIEAFTIGRLLVNAGLAIGLSTAGLITLASAGLEIASPGPAPITVAGGGNLAAAFQGPIEVQAQAIALLAAQIVLGSGAVEGLVKESFLAHFSSHFHIGNLGAPTSPPTIPAVPGTHSTLQTKAS